MTVSSTQSYIEYNGDGSTTSFPIPFYFLLNSDISAMVQDASGNVIEQVNGNDFFVTGGGDSAGGMFTASAAYPSGSTVLIYRSPPVTQETKYYENGKFPAISHESALDKLTMLIQQYGWEFDLLSLRKPSIFAKFYDAKGNRISGLADPSAPNDAVNKSYADAIGNSGRAYTDAQIQAEAAARISADAAEANARAAADANIQKQLTGTVPLEASAFSVISWHKQTVDNSVTIPDHMNAWSFGPDITISPGQQVTIPEHSVWTVANGRQVTEPGINVDYGEL